MIVILNYWINFSEPEAGVASSRKKDHEFLSRFMTFRAIRKMKQIGFRWIGVVDRRSRGGNTKREIGAQRGKLGRWEVTRNKRPIASRQSSKSSTCLPCGSEEKKKS